VIIISNDKDNFSRWLEHLETTNHLTAIKPFQKRLGLDGDTPVLFGDGFHDLSREVESQTQTLSFSVTGLKLGWLL